MVEFTCRGAFARETIWRLKSGGALLFEAHLRACLASMHRQYQLLRYRSEQPKSLISLFGYWLVWCCTGKFDGEPCKLFSGQRSDCRASLFPLFVPSQWRGLVVACARRSYRVTFIKKLLLWLVGLFAFFALLGAISLGVIVTIYWPTLPQVPDPEEYIKSLPGVTRIYGSRGELLAEIAEEYRDTIPYERIPKQVVQALVAAEDQRFFEHHGVDYSGLARAVLTNLEQGQIVQGGSSLTQQLAKALLGNNERTFDRKIQDFLFALSIEKKLSKEQEKLLEQFAAASNPENHPENKSFFDKVKELFG